LEELRPLLLAFTRASGFQRAAELERADGGGGQERGEDEVGARGDDDDLVFAWVEVAGERVAGPAGAEDYYSLAVWEGMLLGRDMGDGGLWLW